MLPYQKFLQFVFLLLNNHYKLQTQFSINSYRLFRIDFFYVSLKICDIIIQIRTRFWEVNSIYTYLKSEKFTPTLISNFKYELSDSQNQI